jgi:hypothetical protein
MGWLFKPGSTRKGLIGERIDGWERTNNGLTVKSTCLAHCYRGGNFTGVLWTVWERTYEKDGQQTQPTERWIGCDLLEYSKSDQGWGYKDMEEAMGPYYFSCPLTYLAMVPVVTNQTWREGVQQYHARKKEKRLAKSALAKKESE